MRFREAETVAQAHRATEWPIWAGAQGFGLDLSLCTPHKDVPFLDKKVHFGQESVSFKQL